MPLKELIQSIVDEGSGVVVATLGSDYSDSRYIRPEDLTGMLASGHFGPEWRPEDASPKELLSLFEEAGHRPDEIDWRGFSRGNGKREYLYLVKDQRVLLSSPA